jgi:biopolymer transport protein ExbD
VKVKSIKVGKKSLTVKWAKVSSKQKITKYQIRYKAKGASKWKVKTVSAKLAKKSLTSLKKGKKYYVSVRAKKGGYYGAWSGAKLSSKVK